MRPTRQLLWAVAICVVIVGAASILLAMRYAAGKLDRLRQQPAYASAEEAMRQGVLRDYPGGRVHIVGGGEEVPGVAFIVARVWPAATDSRARGENGGRREIGWHFTHMEHGWVYLPGDDLTAPVFAVGKLLIDSLPGTRRGAPSRDAR
jgi:hypothetical protein